MRLYLNIARLTFTFCCVCALKPNDSMYSKHWKGKVQMQRDRYSTQSAPFKKPSLRQLLNYARPLNSAHSDPRRPEHVELHSARLLPLIEEAKPLADPAFIQLHYRSRGERLPIRTIANFNQKAEIKSSPSSHGIVTTYETRRPTLAITNIKVDPFFDDMSSERTETQYDDTWSGKIRIPGDANIL